MSLAGGTWHGPNIGDFALVEAWASPDAKLRELDGKGLDGAVVSIAPKPLYFFELPLAPQSAVATETNLGLAEYCAVHPDRLRWMAHVPLGWPEAAAETLEEAVGLGASGVQVGTSAAGRRLDDPALDPFWETVERLNVPVFIHPGYELQIQAFADWNLGAIIGLPLETTIALERLVCAGHFDRYPSLRVVGAHGGGFFPYNVGRLRNYIRVRAGAAGPARRALVLRRAHQVRLPRLRRRLHPVPGPEGRRGERHDRHRLLVLQRARRAGGRPAGRHRRRRGVPAWRPAATRRSCSGSRPLRRTPDGRPAATTATATSEDGVGLAVWASGAGRASAAGARHDLQPQHLRRAGAAPRGTPARLPV